MLLPPSALSISVHFHAVFDFISDGISDAVSATAELKW